MDTHVMRSPVRAPSEYVRPFFQGGKWLASIDSIHDLSIQEGVHSTRYRPLVTPGGITKPRCVEIVVNREVEQWEDNAGRRPPSRDLANAV